MKDKFFSLFCYKVSSGAFVRKSLKDFIVAKINLTLSHPYLSLFISGKYLKCPLFRGKHSQINYLKDQLLQKTTNATSAILCTLPPEEKKFYCVYDLAIWPFRV